MNPAADLPPLMVIAGPTASGKTALAIALAERLESEIISADSMQFYRGMEIGTAAPAKEEQERIRHHFVSFIEPDQEMAAGEYQKLARAVVSDLNRQGKCAVAAGGSGLYISALVDGLFEGPARHPEIRQRLKAEAAEQGNAAMMNRLRRIDPDYAALLSSENDLVRIVRALEVHEVTGEPFSKLHREHQAQLESLPALQVALDWDREALYDRINRRVDMMIEAGWLEEVARLLEAGYEKDIYRIKALGFREIAAHLNGNQSLEAAIEATKMHHRRYAKRQISWFRSDERVTWIAADEDADPDTLADQVFTLLRNHSAS